jgi:hypothetical protein
MNDLLTEAEIIKLTGAKQASKQMDVLNNNGIYYIVKKDKGLNVTWYAVHHPNNQQTIMQDLPDFDAMATSN